MDVDFLGLTIYATMAVLIILISYGVRFVYLQRVEMYDTDPCDIERDYLEHKARHEGE